MSFLFGGPKFDYSQLPGAQQYIDTLSNFDPAMYGGTGGGHFLKGARADYDALRNGTDIGNIAGFKGTEGAINAAYASGDRERERDMAGDMALANHPELLAAQKADLQNESNQNRANSIAQAAGGFYNNTENFGQAAFESAQQRRLQAAGMKLNADQAAAGDYMNSFKAPTSYSNGLFGGLVGAAGALLGGPGGAAIAQKLFGNATGGADSSGGG